MHIRFLEIPKLKAKTREPLIGSYAIASNYSLPFS
jgi:hypothetical protein